MTSVIAFRLPMATVISVSMLLLSAASDQSKAKKPEQQLPVIKLSSTMSSVITPSHESENSWTPYDGVFDYIVSKNESVLISFSNYTPYFHTCQESTPLLHTYLNLTVVNENTTSTWCEGPHKIPTQLVHSSFRLRFHRKIGIVVTESKTGSFRMTMVILPRSEEPTVLPGNLFNCSVPSFHSFRPLLGCNLLKECEGGEDERGCAYSSDECGDDAIDAGTKCYRLVRPQRPLTWFDAASDCTRHGQNLATFGTVEEFTHFKTAITYAALVRDIFVGAQFQNQLTVVWKLSLYRNTWHWVNKRTAFSIEIEGQGDSPLCSFYAVHNSILSATSCLQIRDTAFVCEFDKSTTHNYENSPASLTVHAAVHYMNVNWNISVVQCPSGHVSRDFLSCDTSADCGVTEPVRSCVTGGITVPMFVCQRSRSTLHYTLVCDHMQHCSDNSDEDFCQYPDCPPSFLACRNGQCIRTEQMCDRKSDCYDDSDEVCWSSNNLVSVVDNVFVPPGVLHLDPSGKFMLSRINNSAPCPYTHFQCLKGFCLPFYLRCNGVDDCPTREDEAGCDRYVCSGFYRCRSSKVCIHADNVCDGLPQCPQQDDELLCDLVCPHQCRCQGLAFVCTSKVDASTYPNLRYLDAGGTGMLLRGVGHCALLIGLGLSKCRISNVQLNITLPNLRELDLSWNYLTQVDLNTFSTLKNLRFLLLASNPLVHIINVHMSGSVTSKLQHLDLSNTSLEILSGKALSSTTMLKVLNMSGTKLTTIEQDGFYFTPLLELVDVTGSPLTIFPNDLLRNLQSLRTVHADNYKLCCEAMLPMNFDLRNCHTLQDLLASCEDLLRSNSYRFFLWVFASMSVVGNVVSFVARVYLQKKSGTPGSFSIFVANLCIADFFMGVYLAVIGMADLSFHGQYLWRDDEWKSSTVCKIAGFICLMSSEVSAFIICLITLDRYLVLRFPFSRLHFGRRSAVAACGVVWAVGITLAVIPLMPGTSQWEFYSQTGICTPLPFTKSDQFLGYSYSFGVSILLNLVLFHLIAVGQALVYWSVHSNSLPSSNDRSSRDAVIARRLTTVVISDFLCWFPVGLLGLLASRGTPIPGEVSVAVVIFVLPVNSALNPFLYTFNLVMERRRKAVHENLLKLLENQVRAERCRDNASRKTLEHVNKSPALEQIKEWLCERVLTPEDLLLGLP